MDTFFDEKIPDSDAIFFTGMNRLAMKYKQRAERRVADSASRGRPSWASSNSSGSLPSALKRKFGHGEVEADRPGPEHKRPKGGTEDPNSVNE
jgi:hypothetical protein